MILPIHLRLMCRATPELLAAQMSLARAVQDGKNRAILGQAA